MVALLTLASLTPSEQRELNARMEAKQLKEFMKVSLHSGFVSRFLTHFRGRRIRLWSSDASMTASMISRPNH
jgi:hypothetical protein